MFRRVLVADDDKLILKTIKNFLKPSYDVDTAERAGDALDLLKKYKYDLIIIDVMMPEVSGFEFLNILRQISNQEIPVIMMSGDNNPKIFLKTLESGANDFLQKPITKEVLMLRLKKCFDRSLRQNRGNQLRCLIKEEKKHHKTLSKQFEGLKNLKEINENIETPMSVVVSTISNLVNGTYTTKQSYKLAIITIFRTLAATNLYKPAFTNLFKEDKKMDEEIRTWLTTEFTNDEKTREKILAKKLRSIKSMINLRRSTSVPPFTKKHLSDKLLKSTEFDTRSYDINTLKQYAFTMFKDSGFLRDFGISKSDLWNMINDLEKNYHNNSYHNFYHALDVTQYVYYLINDDKIKELLPKFKRFSLIISALFHDVDHPGVNNNYMINSESELACIYNDQSVLENHHCKMTFEILEKHRILKGLTKQQLVDFRKIMIKLILGTDLKLHFEFILKFQARIATTPISKSEEDQLYVMKLLLKCADISNISRPFPIARKWAKYCIREFLQQGDLEKEKGLDVGPLNDRDNLNFPKSQINFVDYIAGTLFRTLTSCFPQFSHIVKSIEKNKILWEKLLSSKKLEIEDSFDDKFLALNNAKKKTAKITQKKKKTEVVAISYTAFYIWCTGLIVIFALLINYY